MIYGKTKARFKDLYSRKGALTKKERAEMILITYRMGLKTPRVNVMK